MKVLCIDVGGSFLKHTAIEDDQKIGRVGSLATPRDSLESFMRAVKSIYEIYEGVSGIAVSTPGIVDVEKGFMYTGGSLDYIRNIHMAERISGMCGGLPVSVENDAKAAATAELYAGVLKDVKNGIVLTIGTAIGGTIIIDRKILRGNNLFAGEMSYAIYHDDGVRDERKWNLQKNMWGFRGVPSRIVNLYGDKDLRSEVILQRGENGDTKAEEAVRTTAGETALLVHNLQCCYDPELIALGGGISAQPEYIRMVREELSKINRLFHGVVPMSRVEPCYYFNNANLLGAYFAYRNRRE